MEYRRLGKAGIRVSALSLGGWPLWIAPTEVPTAGKRLLIQERARGLSAKPESIDQIKHIIEGTKASLERLGTDHVDLIFAHRPDNETPIEETVRAFNYLIDHGLAFYWGTPEWSAQQITEAHRVAGRLGHVGPSMEQPQYNMFERESLRGMPLLNLRWFPHSPLASGVLSGKYNSLTVPTGSRFALDDALMKSIANRYFATEEGKPIAEQVGGTTTQLALVWCLKNPNVSTAITGASRKEQVSENMAALKLVDKLSPDVLVKIEKILGNKPDTAPRFGVSSALAAALPSHFGTF
ncbi:Aldo/keto reductase [Gonapodya prolifera JEL478]|uniref:Aldo/keto reductase n=1 Tax=Gonapodya prolifera (strain JEL478) TaxID=1344416 RepID=A0A139A1K0_GONPJ|nr:Aldo/keto reductase [Gonapodya prolifera JEL478]|eukprot:KXS10657.1 Aldo/keto reductase [Gonapodya prolifera JEL478]